MCQHDPMYRVENEANGGAGCPLCNKERRDNFGLNPAQIADMQARCAETERGDDYDSRTEGGWR